MTKPPDVRVVVPSSPVAGVRLFINGVEFEGLSRLKFSSQMNLDDVRISTLEITFTGDLLVEKSQ